MEVNMASFNKVILLGNLTRDPQLSYTPNQTAVVDFGLATNRKWKDQNGNSQEETCFVDCRAFGRSAENINKYCNKGNPLLVEGHLRFSSWEAQDGSKRSKLSVTVRNFQFIGSGGGSGGQGQDGPAAAQQAGSAQQTGGADAAVDADIPF
jgi:single-strand DNA-binding protein